MGRHEDLVAAAFATIPFLQAGEAIAAAYAQLEIQLRNQAAQEAAELHAVCVCHCCGRLYSREEWAALPLLASWGDAWVREDTRRCETCRGRPTLTVRKQRAEPGALDAVTIAPASLQCGACYLPIPTGDAYVARETPRRGMAVRCESFCLPCCEAV